MPLVPHELSTDAAGSQRNSGASTRRLLTTSRLAVTLLLLLKVPVAASTHEELGEVRRRGVWRLRRVDGDVLVERDAGRGEVGQQRAVLGADGGAGVPDLEVCCRALQQRRLHEARGREAVDRDVGRGGDPAAVLQGRDAAVYGRHLIVQGVEICDEGAVRPAVAGACCRCPGWAGPRGGFGTGGSG